MSIWNTLIGESASDASNAAAQDTYLKQQQAINQQRQAGETAQQGYTKASQGYNPYVSAGGSALQQLMAGLGLGAPGSQQDFTNAYRALPGYQSGLETGTNAALRGINASGHDLGGGGAQKALYRYGSDYENQRSGDYLNRLAGLQGQGLSATGAQVGTQAQGVGANLGAQTSAYGGAMDASKTLGQGQVAGAQAEQSALGNLLNAGTYLGGAAIGRYGGGTTQPQGTAYGPYPTVGGIFKGLFG